MHRICVVYFSVIAWNTLEDLQNYSDQYSRSYVISNYRHSSVSQTILHQQTTKSKSSPDPVLVKKTWNRILSDAAGVRVQKNPKTSPCTSLKDRCSVPTSGEFVPNWAISATALWNQGCQIGFFDDKFHKFGFFRGRWRQKIVWLFGFFFSNIWLFLEEAHTCYQTHWCLGFLIKILLKTVIIRLYS